MRIFISYGHDEYAEIALRLKEDLIARGHEVWFDKDRIKPGSDYECYIDEGLNWCARDPGSGRVVLLMTPHSVRRPNGYCLNEIARALYLRLLVVPVMVIWCEPPLSICRIQWLDMQDCIPVGENPQRYEHKRNLLIHALEEGNFDFEATQSALFHHLQPLDFSADIAQHVQNFVGRQWIFDRIDTWLDVPNASRIFWITGSPGVGKTAIASYLCHKRREVVAFHLCRHGHDEKSDPKRCVLSLAYQLSSQFPEYRERIAILSGDLNKSPATLFDNLIVQPLARQPHRSDRPVLLIIDGMDEATRHGRNELAEFIAKEFPRTPPWIRLLITSRPEPEVVQPLQALSPYYLDAGSPENLIDIRTYLREFLPSSFPNYIIDDQTIDAILEKSEGIFLYVETVIRELKEGRLTLDQLHEFPQGLGGSFFSFFSRQFPDISSYQQRHRPFLEMIIAAREPLPLKLAQDALRWSPYDYKVNERGEIGGEALTPLGSLFLYGEDQIRPFHQSIVDWLTDAAKAGPYFVDMREGHRRLAEACWAEYQAGVEKMSPYSLAHLSTHLIEMERWEDLLVLVKDPKVGLMTKWVEGGEGEKGRTCLLGLIDYLEKQGRDPVTSAGLATQVARIHSLWGEYEDAERWLKHGLAKTSWLRGRRVRAVALHELGSLNLYKGKFRESARYYQNALRLCRWGLPIYHDEAAANLIGIATVAHERYRFQEAVRMAAQACREAKKVGDIRHIIAAERLLGSAYMSLGRYVEAETRFHVGIDLCEKYKIDLEKPRLLLHMGSLKYKLAILLQELPAEAEPYFKTAMSEAQRVSSLYCMLWAKMSLGRCALVNGLTATAINLFSQLREALPPGRHLELQVGVQLGLAYIAHQEGKPEMAGKLYGEIIDFCREHDIRTGLRGALVGLGAINWHLDKYESAQIFWEQALQTAEQISKAERPLTEISIAICKRDPYAIPR